MSTAAVKIKVTIAQPFVVAGTPFSLTTTVENAHEGSIELIEFGYHIPYQMQWISESNFNTSFAEIRKIPFYLRPFKPSPLSGAVQPPGQEMSYTWRDGPQVQQPLMTVLPSESTTYSFKAIVPNWLFISGGEIVFPGRITYRYKQELHFAPFEIRLTLRPPILANCIGAIVGSILGSCARSLQEQGSAFLKNPSFDFFAATILAAILAVIAVIYASRRTGESQPILTIEDLWGGLVVGFLMGYLGHEYFQKFVPIAK
jgi:hypothetical protein